MNKTIKRITQSVIRALRENIDAIQHFDNSPLPNKAAVNEFIEEFLFLLFPGYFGQSNLSFEFIEVQIELHVASIFERLKAEVLRELLHSCRKSKFSCKNCEAFARSIVEQILCQVPILRERLELDVRAAFNNDPAASGFDEIIFSYPGIEAIAIFRVAHELHKAGLALIPRIMTEHAHSRTGIDIHPGATIGESFFIDHGTGVVIGETSQIKNRVTIYQGVTLGSMNFPRDSKGGLIRGKKRHPTIEDDVIIYAGATILGGDTTIGRGAVIGGNVWLTKSIPPYSQVLLMKNDVRIIHSEAREKEVNNL